MTSAINMAAPIEVDSPKKLKNFKVPCSRRVAYKLAKKDEFDLKFNREYDTLDCSAAIGPRTSKEAIHLRDRSDYSAAIGPRTSINDIHIHVPEKTETGKEEGTAGEFTIIDLIVTLISIGFFFYDVVSDMFLAYSYYSHQRWLHFALTTVFIAAPSVISNIHSLVWYRKDYLVEEKESKKDPKLIRTPGYIWRCRVIFTFPFMLGPVVRHVEYICHGLKSNSKKLSREKRDYHFQQMLLEDTDAGLMRMLEGFLEAAPQLILQMYILITERPEEAIYMRYIRPIAMLGSWIGLTWSLVSYYKALRAIHEINDGTAETIDDIGSFFRYFIKTAGYFLWRASEVGPRVVVIALFASQFTFLVFIALGIHWIFMFVWLRCQKTNFYKDIEKKKHAEIVFNIIVGYICIFCFLNPRDGHTRYRALIYYLVFYMENFIMLMAWAYFTDDKGDWFYLGTVALVPVGLVFQIFFQMLFYKCCHTKKGEIVYCLPPRENFNFFVSVCHEVDEPSHPETVPV